MVHNLLISKLKQTIHKQIIQDVDAVMQMYNLLKYSDNNSKTYGG